MTNASELLEGTTPGPWEYTPTVAFHDRPDLPCVVDRHRLVVAQFWDDGHSEDECEANARLAAAAPDLARQVTQLEAQLKLAGNRLRAAAVNEVAKSGQTREYYEYSEWADEIDALLTKEPK